MKPYKAAKGSRYTRADAQKIGPVLSRLSRQNRSSARDILDEARKKKSPLHSYFDWDDSSAAEKYRLVQAREMSRSITIEVEMEGGEKRTIRAFHCVTMETANPGTERHYRTISQIRRSGAAIEELVENARRELEAFKRKYAVISEYFEDLWKEVVEGRPS